MNAFEKIAETGVKGVLEATTAVKGNLIGNGFLCQGALVLRDTEHNEALLHDFCPCLCSCGCDCGGEVPRNSYPGQCGSGAPAALLARQNVAAVLYAVAPLVLARENERLTDEEWHALLGVAIANIRALQAQRPRTNT